MSADSPEMTPREHPRTIGWIGTTALAVGGSNQSLFLIGALVAAQGTAAIPLLVVGLLLSWAAVPGWTELVMMWPNRVGGIAATCSEAFRPYSPVLANLTGTCYWWGWVPTCGLTAILSATAIQQWYLPSVPVKVIATGIILIFTLVNLRGVRWVSRFAVAIASCSFILAMLSGLIPVFTGNVDWRQASTFHLTLPFHGFFGVVTSAMAGLYLIGFAAPAFEAATCHVGETVNPNRNVPRAIFASAGIASIYFILLPVVWLGVLGQAGLQENLATTLGPTFAPLLGVGAKAAALWFMVFNMFHGTLQPLAGASRTLSQLSDDGLLPRSLAKRNRYDCPWVATLLTAFMSTALLISGDPPAVLAAANLTYLISICLPSVAVLLLRRHAPDMPRPWRAPKYTIGLGVAASCGWGVATVLGFEQFGIKYVLLGLALAYSGSLAYSWRTWQDRRAAGVSRVRRSLGFKLTGSMLAVMALDGTGYLIAVGYVDNRHAVMVVILQDIFVVVALLTISVGLILPGMISHAVVQVSEAAQRLQRGTLGELTRAMDALGAGNLAAAKADPQVFRVDVRTKDEVAVMAESFNSMQDEVAAAARSLDGAREELQAGRERLEYIAGHDALTGLANRRRFDEILDDCVSQARTKGTSSCLTMFDLDNFKLINDSRGHIVGDEVLRLVADTLRSELGPHAIVARLGGDEFAFLLPGADIEEGMATSRRTLAALRDHSSPLDGGRRMSVSASAGMTVIDSATQSSAGQLMMDIDVAMYEAKEAGGNRVAVASADGSGRKSITSRQEWLETIREALDGHGFELYAQPIRSLTGDSAPRIELLLRLIGDDGAPISPEEFLPIAERHGLIKEIDQWVVAEAFSLLRQRLAVDELTHFEVNLSGLSIGDADLESLIESEMAMGDIPAGAMTFEITETAVIVDLESAGAFARRISALGCGWALDDFGSGFGSFLYLKMLPFDYVKIDGSFIREIRTSDEDRHVVQAMVQIARSMRLQTIAEFVEDRETLELLRDLGVDHAQGYYVGRPAPLSRSATVLPAPRPPLDAQLTDEASEVEGESGEMVALQLHAAALGATDVFVFRRVGPGRLLHVGGIGRGSGWAGNLELVEGDLAYPNGSIQLQRHRWDAAEPMHILGPYYARSAALVHISADVCVLIGSRDSALSRTDAELDALASSAASLVSAVSTTKGLADELEVLHAMKAVMQCSPGSVGEAMRYVAQVATEGLSCEVAAVWLRDTDQLELVENGWQLESTAEDVRAALLSIPEAALRSPVVQQKSEDAPLPGPLGPTHGVTSHYVLPLGAPAVGYLVLLHTKATPRGFTTLCKQVGQTIAQAAGVVIHAAQLRGDLHKLVEDAQATARMDSLTGLLNRRGWDEALADVGSRSTPVWTSIGLIDLNELKRVNDTQGHEAGDDYLRNAARRLRASADPGDLIARIGGDEFALLRLSAEPPSKADLGTALRRAFADDGGLDIPLVRAAIGTAHCPPEGDLADTVRRADAAMYLDKSLARPRRPMQAYQILES